MSPPLPSLPGHVMRQKERKSASWRGMTASAWACLASQLRRLNICLYIHVVGNTTMATELKDTLYMDLVIHGVQVTRSPLAAVPTVP